MSDNYELGRFLKQRGSAGAVLRAAHTCGPLMRAARTKSILKGFNFDICYLYTELLVTPCPGSWFDCPHIVVVVRKIVLVNLLSIFSQSAASDIL